MPRSDPRLRWPPPQAEPAGCIAFVCACGKTLRVGPRFAGKEVRCDRCDRRVRVPDGPEAVGTPAPPPVRPAGSPRKWVGEAAVTTAAVALLVLRVALPTADDRPGRPPAASEAGSVVLPSFPDRGPAFEVAPGAVVEEVRTGPRPSGPGVTLRLYLPAGAHPARSLPCVLIAPAGGTLVTGRELPVEGDHSEHLPYVREGFAVLAYGLDGELAEPRDADDASVRRACAAFLAARAGLDDARVALGWLCARVPEVDPGRVYAAGHGTAGTSALRLAAYEPRVRACAALAPRSDVEAGFDAHQKDRLRQLVPRIDELFTTYNPRDQAARVRGPVFLFHARDDPVIPVAETETFATVLGRLGKDVRLETVATGGHNDAVIRQGIPRAAAWLKALDRGR